MMSYRFNQNRACEYFPCHKVADDSKFNCLFCYCPLYLLKKDCGGNFKYSENIKDCSFCLVPHGENGYDHIMEKMEEVIKRCGE
ncbi:MAG: cysteine-rich small domain [Anaerosolibacter sp.]|jgi:Zn-finger protein|nr:cysteine-rich small domain [Anaerosolibacter sp.]